MIAKEMIQWYDIREVCVDCKHLYQYDELIGDEEFTYFGCHENGCVTCHGEDYPELECENKIKGDNLLFDEEKDNKWEKRTRDKIKQFLLTELCPYCDCILIYKDKTPRYLNKCIDDILHEIKHDKCYFKIEGVESI